MMESIASMATSMSAAQFATTYSMSMAKKSMDVTEDIAQKMLEMLPPAPGQGQYIDTYA